MSGGIVSYGNGVSQVELEHAINERLKPIEEKLEKQNELLQKIASLVTQIHQDGEPNKDTFNKLDEFLKPYFENPYNDGKF